MPDGSPDWLRPAHEPDNSIRAMAGRLAAVAALNLFAIAGSGASVWLTLQPWFLDLTAGFLLSLPGPGLVWQSVQALAVLLVVPAALVWAGRRLRTLLRERRAGLSSPRVAVEVLAGSTDPAIPAGQLVYRRFDSPALAGPASLPDLPEIGQVEARRKLSYLTGGIESTEAGEL